MELVFSHTKRKHFWKQSCGVWKGGSEEGKEREREKHRLSVPLSASQV